MLYYISGDYMKLEDLENYRDENGYIDMDKVLLENQLETIFEGRGRIYKNKDNNYKYLSNCGKISQIEEDPMSIFGIP